jgi:hypothetical protein
MKISWLITIVTQRPGQEPRSFGPYTRRAHSSGNAIAAEMLAGQWRQVISVQCRAADISIEDAFLKENARG